MRADACACILSIYSVELREFAGQVASSLAGAGRTDRLNDEGGPNWVLPRRGFRRPAGPRGKGHGEEAGNPLRVTTRVPHAAGKVTRCLAQACCVILPLVGATYLEPGDLLPIAARKAHTHRFRAPTVPRTLARHGHHESHSLDRSRAVAGSGSRAGLLSRTGRRRLARDQDLHPGRSIAAEVPEAGRRSGLRAGWPSRNCIRVEPRPAPLQRPPRRLPRTTV